MNLFSEYKGLRKEMYVLFIGRIMTNLGAMIWPMFTLILNRKLGLNAGTIAVCMVIYSIVALPISLIGGRLADKISKKHIIIFCDIISILAYFFCATREITIFSIAVFACASLFQSIEEPSYSALVADFTTSKDRERAYSLNYLGGNLGLVLAPSIGGILFNSHLNLAFAINGFSIALSTILIAVFIKDTHREVDDSLGGYENEIDGDASAFSYILENKVILIFVFVSAFAHSVYAMFNYLMPLDLSLFHGDSGSVIFGSMTSVNCIIVVLLTAVLTRIFRKVRDIDKMFLAESLILGGYVLFMSFVKSVWMCYVAISVFTLGEILNTLSLTPFLTRRIPSSHRGRIISIKEVAGAICVALFEMVIGFTYDSFGSIVAWGTVILLGMAELYLVYRMKKRDRKEYRHLY